MTMRVLKEHGEVREVISRKFIFIRILERHCFLPAVSQLQISSFPLNTSLFAVFLKKVVVRPFNKALHQAPHLSHLKTTPFSDPTMFSPKKAASQKWREGKLHSLGGGGLSLLLRNTIIVLFLNLF
jgi:hypothetical protein